MISHNLSSDMKTAQFCGKEVNPLVLHPTACHLDVNILSIYTKVYHYFITNY
jgi:hypothetical protein